MSELFKSSAGRWMIRQGSKVRFARREEYPTESAPKAKKRKKAPVDVTVQAPAGVDVEVVVDSPNGTPSRASHPRKEAKMADKGTCDLLGERTVKEPASEALWDVSCGFLDGLAATASAAGYRSSAERYLAEARALYDRAHAQNEKSRRDDKQYELGKRLASVVGLVALHQGWTADAWVAAMPPALQAAGVGGGPVDTSMFGGAQADDLLDLLAGGVGGAAAGDALGAAGATLGGAAGAMLGPAGATIGASLGGLLAQSAGSALGNQAGIAASNAGQALIYGPPAPTAVTGLPSQAGLFPPPTR